MKNKIKTQEELAAIVADLKKQGKKVVTTNGVFDLIHVGHVKSFEDAKKYGDVLVIGINSDTSVRQVRGEKRPLVPQKERAELLAALTVVDYVTTFEETEPSKFLDRIKPSVHIKGKDWQTKFCPEKEVVERNGGKMEFIDLVQGFSTTNLIKKIVEAYGNE
ncbi:MAG TPA: adenylyltransferase/cytidyltransferase family protein [Candidatus Nanoarchaeia archaeon]|nr:adenylyltransferase/cytidyltransferase family protein [Candidatus Nanoarchaeia archaeon]